MEIFGFETANCLRESPDFPLLFQIIKKKTMDEKKKKLMRMNE